MFVSVTESVTVCENVYVSLCACVYECESV